MPFTGSDICKVSVIFPSMKISGLFPRLHRICCCCCLDLVRLRPPLFFFYCSLSTFWTFDRLAIFIPPLGVFLERGCHADFVCFPLF